ncbi:MAG: hypothetical protein ACRDIY_20085 [Chloroflexota bacterium]
MNSRWLATFGVALALAATACSGGAPQTPSSAANGTVAPAATSAPAQAATAPAAPTTAPTAAPTTAPTVAPTVAATATTAPQPTTAAVTPTAAAQASTSGGGNVPPELKAMGLAWANATSFKMSMNTSDNGTQNQITMEIVRPDRQHVKFSAGQQSFEMIDIGTDHYINMGGKWTKTTTKAPTANLADPQATIDSFNKSVDSNTRITKGGTETVNGTPCQDWVVAVSGSGSDESGGGTMCIGLKDNLPVQFKDTAGKFLLTFSDWNAPIDIKPPI